MLTSPLCFSPPWHSKQYFWNVSGAWNAVVPARGDDRWTGWGRRDGTACSAWTGAGGKDGVWAVMIDTSATHTPQRVIDWIPPNKPRRFYPEHGRNEHARTMG